MAQLSHALLASASLALASSSPPASVTAMGSCPPGGAVGLGRAACQLSSPTRTPFCDHAPLLFAACCIEGIYLCLVDLGETLWLVSRLCILTTWADLGVGISKPSALWFSFQVGLKSPRKPSPDPLRLSCRECPPCGIGGWQTSVLPSRALASCVLVPLPSPPGWPVCRSPPPPWPA